jgi:hypothetical protein
LKQLRAQIHHFQYWEKFEFHPHYKRCFDKIAKGAVALGIQRRLFQNKLSKTEAAQKAREKRKKGGKKVI